MKTNIEFLSITLLIFFCVSCNYKQATKPSEIAVPSYIKPLNNKNETTRLWKLAIDSGDFDAYNKLATPYLIEDRNLTELYYYSMIMANKYHCPEAYYTLWIILEHSVSTREMELLNDDKDTKNMALYYLFRAKELGFSHAEVEIEQKFGKGKPVHNSSFFLKQLMNGGK